MSFLHPGLIGALALVAVPIVLHLLLRQKPKKILFPALRLIQQRRRQNVRRMRLRHLWLLLLRMLAIATLVFAIARPSLPAADYSLTVTELLILLAVIAAGLGGYFFLLHRWRKQLPATVVMNRRPQLRGWATGLTILAVLLCVGWPYQRRVAAEITSPAPSARIDLPVAAVFLFDTSTSMEYQQEGLTRLDLARQIAGEHLSALPQGSRVSVADVANDHPIVFQSTLGAAQTRLDALEIKAVRQPFNERLRTALFLQEDDRRQLFAEQTSVAESDRKDRFIRRVYVFTDLAASAWQQGGSSILKGELERLKQVQLFLIDVGEVQPKNAAITATSPSRQRIPRGGSLVVRAEVGATGAFAGERQVELSLKSAAGQTSSQGRRPVELQRDATQRIEFPTLSNLTGTLVQGEVRLVSSDPLPSDDVRYFSVEVGPAPKVLIVAPDRRQSVAWQYTLVPGEEKKFDLKFVTAARLITRTLSAYDVVCLINVPRLTDEQWRDIGQFVDAGGGLAVFLGNEGIDPVSYNRGQPQTFLPAQLKAYVLAGDVRLSLDNLNHPALRKVRDNTDAGSVAILEQEVQFRKFWQVERGPDSAVLATYTDDQRSPALLERLHGKGRVMMFTSSVDDLRGWNTLVRTVNRWAYVAMMQPMTEYLARVTDSRFTYEAGEVVSISLPVGTADQEYLLRRPDLTQERRTLAAGRAQLVIDDAAQIGHYELVDTTSNQTAAGFSVSASAAESDFTRMAADDLDTLLGKGRYSIARNMTDLQSDINIADLGQEVFPLVMVLVVLAFCGEHFVANRFYEVEDEGAAIATQPTRVESARETATVPATPS